MTAVLNLENVGFLDLGAMIAITHQDNVPLLPMESVHLDAVQEVMQIVAATQENAGEQGRVVILLVNF